MANMRAAANTRSSAPGGKQSFLPPKCPFPTVSPSYGEHGSIGSKCIPRPKEGQRHQRTSSESFLIEEQPSWLDDLLNEPDTPVKKGAHRRSTSDSFAYLDGVNFATIGNVDQDQLKQPRISVLPALSPWNSQQPDHHKDVQHAPYYPATNSSGRPQHRVWESAGNVVNYPGRTIVEKEKTSDELSACVPTESDKLKPDTAEKNEHPDCTQDSKGSSEKKDGSHLKLAEVDTKRVKQQYAQRSRVRKLQYIAELEKHVQALQSEGLEFSAELEFLDQQNLILNLENQALKQRLDSLAQEKLIKRLQQETLEREIARLRALYQQQQQQQLQEQPYPTHRRSSSRDVDSQFANLSLKQKDKSSAREPVSGPLRI
ncbi:hypothetical protein Cni_G09978 [Canna indica]|uniref:BZIP domain-containing protein n=1 Tax=Canna indica TaxID=4628 RepID=A0AAQ3K6N6_9LILI|nr:hypothetical protein Cni_G09978 [Canna indica]